MIAGGVALSVGDPGTSLPPGFAWTRLTDVARLESGHTPSRRHPEYWDGEIPWIGIKDATANHGRRIRGTNQRVTQVGIDNSSARVLPADTVCLSRTASVGYVLEMGVPMATSQDFVNWVCGPQLDHRYLKYVLLAEHDHLHRFASGTTHQTIYFPEVKAFHVALPPVEYQRAVADVLNALDDKIETNERMAAAAFELVRVARLQLAARPDVRSCAIRDVATVNATTLRSADLPDHIEYVDISSVRPDAIVAARRVSKADAPGRARRFVSDGDTIISMVRPGRRAHAWMSRPAPETVVSTGFAVLTPSNGASTLLYATVSSDAFIDYLESVAEGSAYPAVKPDQVAAGPALDGPKEVLADFEAAHRPLLDRAGAAQRESLVLGQLRDALLPKLLSGELRIRAAEDHLEEAGV